MQFCGNASDLWRSMGLPGVGRATICSLARRVTISINIIRTSSAPKAPPTGFKLKRLLCILLKEGVRIYTKILFLNILERKIIQYLLCTFTGHIYRQTAESRKLHPCRETHFISKLLMRTSHFTANMLCFFYCNNVTFITKR